jgi:hypothetical protein
MPTQIRIPELLATLLRSDLVLQAAVSAALSDFEPWLAHSKTPFFPDYTDHGPVHIAETLLAATALITPEAASQLSAGDAAVLVLATLLHDSAMHLTEEGIATLVGGNYVASGCPNFDDEDWPEAWERFLFDAARWSNDKIAEVFSLDALKAEPLFKVPNLKEPLNLTLRDRLLIGEFIRAHHARLSHEFAIFGVPGPKIERLRLDAHLQPDLRNIVGLVARSHGVALRDCVRVLEELRAVREYRGIHCVYLMTLLRVGDYLQIQAERAPYQVLKIKSIRSPLSLREWTAHAAVRDIGTFENDPEAILVQAYPEDVHTFLRLRDWLQGIQLELDQSWAVLGEVYGRYGCLKELGLTIRRIRSNLDDQHGFASSVNYVPELMRLTVAKGELLALLLEPLYGARPEVGIRELVQNAVDAVRERLASEQRRGLPWKANDDSQPPVVVTVIKNGADGGPVLRITDCGIGMSISTLRDYYLVVGASYRQSRQWQREFEVDGTPLRARILRSGRFGIGTLAAFLLGSRVHLRTRHLMDKRGVATEFTLESRAIELRFSDNAAIGTSVEIPLTNRSYEILTHSAGMGSWDWYCLADPKVERRIGDKVLPQRWIVPGPDSEVRAPWRSFVPKGFQRVDWSHGSGPPLACNGILVKSAHSWNQQHEAIWDFGRSYIGRPNISVFDPDAKLPLNLERSDLTTAELPFHNELTLEVLRDFSRFLIASSRGKRIQTILDLPLYEGLSQRTRPEPPLLSDLQPFFAGQSGIAPLDPWLLRAFDPHRLLYVRDSRVWDFLPKRLGPNDAVLGPLEPYLDRKYEYARSARDVARIFMLSPGSAFFGTGLSIRGLRILVTEPVADAVIGSFKHDMQGRRTWSSRGWALLEVGNCTNSVFEGLEKLTEPSDGAEHVLGVEVFVDKCADTGGKSVISKIWSELGGSPLIGFDCT